MRRRKSARTPAAVVGVATARSCHRRGRRRDSGRRSGATIGHAVGRIRRPFQPPHRTASCRSSRRPCYSRRTRRTSRPWWFLRRPPHNRSRRCTPSRSRGTAWDTLFCVRDAGGAVVGQQQQQQQQQDDIASPPQRSTAAEPGKPHGKRNTLYGQTSERRHATTPYARTYTHTHARARVYVSRSALTGKMSCFSAGRAASSCTPLGPCSRPDRCP